MSCSHVAFWWPMLSECEDFKEAGADIDLVCDNTIQIACRSDVLSRAVRNLVENAVKYGGRTHVKVLRTPNDIRIIISDKGPGTPKEKLDEALQPFTRLSDAREGDKGGFGLGLAIVQAVVEGYDGKFDLFPA